MGCADLRIGDLAQCIVGEVIAVYALIADDAPGPEFVSLSVLVLEPVAMRGLFGAIAADRHAAPSSCTPARTVPGRRSAAFPECHLMWC